MRAKLVDGRKGQATYVIVLHTGDEVLAALQSFVDTENISAAQFSAIGAFSKATLLYFDWETKSYQENCVSEQVEVAALNGDVAMAPDGSRALHIHTVLGRRDGSALAGHLGDAHVRPTLEIVLTEMPQHLRKKTDPQTGLALIAI